MSHEERVSWVALLVNLVLGFWYFSVVLALPADADLFGANTGAVVVTLIVAAIVLTICCEVALRVVQQARGEKTDAASRDERDALIGLRATRNAHGVLGFSVVIVLVQIALIEWAARYRSRRGPPETVLELLGTGPLQSMHVAQMLLLALTLAAITLNASRVFYYRRGF